MPEPPRIGVVTVTYNSGKVIDDFMRCLLKQDYEKFTLYVIDNASSDGTLQRVSRYHDSRIVVVANRANVGVAEGNNQGIRAALAANCEYVLLINNDTEFDVDLISKLYAGCREHQCDMVVPKILYYETPDKIWYAGGTFSRLRGYTGSHEGIDCHDLGQFDVPRKVEYAPTCCMLLHREVFQRVGLMDTRYFVYFDDTDFCLRALRCGQKLYCLPSIRLLHKVASLSGGSESAFTIRYVTRNHVYYLIKNFGWFHALYYLPLYQLRIVFKLLRARLSLTEFRTSQAGFWEGLQMPASRERDDVGLDAHMECEGLSQNAVADVHYK